MYLCILNGNTGIAHGLGLGLYGVASLIGLLIFIELHLEGRAFIFFYADANVAIGSTDGETAIQLTGRQCKLHTAFSETVGSCPLLSNHFVVGIAQLKRQRLATVGSIFHCRYFLPGDSRGIDGLAGTIDGSVGK